MKKVVVVVVAIALIGCSKKQIEPKLKNLAFTTEVITFKDGTTWTVVNNPNINK